MIEHVVLIRWMERASQEAIDAAMTELRQLKDKVPGIVDLSCGTNFSDQAKRYTHGLVVRFKDGAALKAYLEHLEHQRVVEKFIMPIRNDILVLDYEF
jgi:hypothetical protein